MKSNALFLFLLIVCHISVQFIFGIPVVDNIKNAAVIQALNEDIAADQPDGPRQRRFGGWGGGTYRYGPCGYGGCRGGGGGGGGYGFGGGGYSGGSSFGGPCGSGEHHSAEVYGCGNKYGR